MAIALDRSGSMGAEAGDATDDVRQAIERATIAFRAGENDVARSSLLAALHHHADDRRENDDGLHPTGQPFDECHASMSPTAGVVVDGS